jgi:hypothetical protein
MRAQVGGDVSMGIEETKKGVEYFIYSVPHKWRLFLSSTYCTRSKKTTRKQNISDKIKDYDKI